MPSEHLPRLRQHRHGRANNALQPTRRSHLRGRLFDDEVPKHPLHGVDRHGVVELGPVARGLARVVTHPARRLATAGVYPGRIVGIQAARDVSEFDNVIVFVGTEMRVDPAPQRVAIQQTNEEFVPHVVAVTTGSTVDFPNDDLIFHNVFSLSRTATFDLGRYPRNTSKARTFVKPGIVTLAALSGAAVVPLAVAASSDWRMPSWDELRIPRPFSRCVVRFGEPIRIARRCGRDAQEGARKEIEAALRAVTWQADDEAAA